MARARRHYIPGHVWHITHRCHKREFLLKFPRDLRRFVTAADPNTHYNCFVLCLFLFFLLFLIPGTPIPRALKGSTGYKVGNVKRFDEKDTVFAWIEGFQQYPDIKQLEEYYRNYLEFWQSDDKERME